MSDRTHRKAWIVAAMMVLACAAGCQKQHTAGLPRHELELGENRRGERAEPADAAEAFATATFKNGDELRLRDSGETVYMDLKGRSVELAESVQACHQLPVGRLVDVLASLTDGQAASQVSDEAGLRAMITMAAVLTNLSGRVAAKESDRQMIEAFVRDHAQQSAGETVGLRVVGEHGEWGVTTMISWNAKRGR